MGNSIETESYMAQSKELEYIAYRRENLKEHGRLFFKFLKLFYVLVFRIDIWGICQADIKSIYGLKGDNWRGWVLNK